jgi:hypothetical protein
MNFTISFVLLEFFHAHFYGPVYNYCRRFRESDDVIAKKGTRPRASPLAACPSEK